MRTAAAQQVLEDAGVDWRSVGEEALDLLRTYVRMPTVNDPGRLGPDQAREEPWLAGNESGAAEWIGRVLDHEGIPHELLESAPGRVNVVARLAGASSSSAASVTLLSHSDVVPARRDEWTTDPFAGVIRDGYLYARGVLDLKGLGIAQLMTVVLLRRLRVPLARDIVLLVAADEETGGRFGAQWLVRNRPELLDTALVLGEGGFSPTGFLEGLTLHAISVAEKGYLELELSAEAHAHHASMPAPDSAPTRLIRALAQLADEAPRPRLTAPSAALLRSLADHHHGFQRWALRHPRWTGRALLRSPLLSGPLLHPMMSDTIAVTTIESKAKSNVVPAQAHATLSIRLLPGTDPDEFVERIRRIASQHDAVIREVARKPATSCGFDTDSFRVLARHAGAGNDRASVTPILSPASSDARNWRSKGVPCYGWVPFPLPVGDVHGVHGPDERVSTASFELGVRTFVGAVAELAAE